MRFVSLNTHVWWVGGTAQLSETARDTTRYAYNLLPQRQPRSANTINKIRGRNVIEPAANDFLSQKKKNHSPRSS